jgi:hypothetical protein
MVNQGCAHMAIDKLNKGRMIVSHSMLYFDEQTCCNLFNLSSQQSCAAKITRYFVKFPCSIGNTAASIFRVSCDFFSHHMCTTLVHHA